MNLSWIYQILFHVSAGLKERSNSPAGESVYSFFWKMKNCENCEICKNYAELKEPMIVKEEISVYGFCFKNFMKNGMMSIYPVYIPGSSRKSFAKKKGVVETDSDAQGQMSITDFPEVLP